jgi:serine/threonine-protein kinase
MATVYLAQDLRHKRRVALKVLHPELASSLVSERFLREIALAGQLQHPHILGLIDSGTLEHGPGRSGPYYVMPYVEGESLRDRLQRERQLSLQDALDIVRDVASALTYAHGHGVVHRDIKPENILLEGGQAVVADFGIARAVQAAGGDKLTETGLALGTPTYMSPEQSAGDSLLDGRADIYSLGCVVYEMLAGEPPFTGPTQQAVLARHALDPVPRLRTVRQTVPRGIEQAISRALAKVPADRFATAEQFATALRGPSSASASATGFVPRAARLRQWLVPTLALMLVSASAITWFRVRASVGRAPLSSVIAVLPFRVSGADSALHYLHEGIVDLLAVKLTGEGGPRAVDPRAVLSAWHRASSSETEDVAPGAALALARRLGAGRIIDGSVVGTTGHVTLTAAVVGVPTGSAGARASVEGPADSMPALIDRLTAQLLVHEAAETEHRLASLSTTSLPALRAYLDGQAANHRGKYAEAVEHFNRALELDSTFALAGLGAITASGWFGYGRIAPVLQLAWASRDRLSIRDRTILTAYVGPHYPNRSSYREFLAARERAVDVAGDQPEAWYELGDLLFHGGPLLDVTDFRSRAADAFQRAVELDSGFAGPLAHLLELSASDGDTAGVRRYAALYLRADSASEQAYFIRWRTAVALGDKAALAELMKDSAPPFSLVRILGTMQMEAIGLEDVDRVAAALARQQPDAGWLRALALNRGHPSEDLAIAGKDPEADPATHGYLRSLMEDALYGEGDSAAAAQAFRDLSAAVDRPSARAQAEGEEQADDICSLTVWRVLHRDLRTVARAIEQLRKSRETDCRLVLEAALASAQHRANAGAAIDRADSSMVLLSPAPVGFAPKPLCLVTARMRESLGDLAGALKLIRKRAYFGGGVVFLSTFLREEGRLAALTGDRAGAIRAYRHYLALRTNPEAAVKPEVDRVRAELANLIAESRP